MRIPVADRRTALIQAALRVIARDGVAAATTRRISAEAGMSLASLHYVFGSRDELIAALVGAVIAQERSDLAPVLDVPPAERTGGRAAVRAAVRSGLQHYLDGVRADPGREKAMFELTQWALREPGQEGLARRQYEHYFSLAEQTVLRAARLTGCEWTRPTAEVARMLVALTDGLTLAWLVTRDDDAAAATMDQAADALAGLARAAGDSGGSGSAPAAVAPATAAARTPTEAAR
jgi:AcrR family transcriptional regulator